MSVGMVCANSSHIQSRKSAEGGIVYKIRPLSRSRSDINHFQKE